MQTMVIRTKIRDGALEDVREWFKVLKSREDELLQSLKAEGVVIEACFLDHRPEGAYLIHYLKARDVSHAYAVFERSDLPIDDYYRRKWKELLEGREELEVMHDIDRIAAIAP